MVMAIGRSNRAPTQVSQSSLLRLGSQGNMVSTLQSMLAEAGFNPRGVDGIFGPNTEAAVKRFQASRGLVRDGIVGPTTWAALSAALVSSTSASLGSSFEVTPTGSTRQLQGMPTLSATPPPAQNAVSSTAITLPPSPATAFREQILSCARGEIGTCERTNNNDGDVTKYPAAFGRGQEKYCADFASWVVNQAGGTMNEAYCPNVVKQLKDQGLWKGRSSPEAGDLVLFDWNHDKVADHIGIVEKVNADGTVNTIEGNAANPGTGIQGVWRHVRSLASVLGFGSPF